MMTHIRTLPGKKANGMKKASFLVFLTMISISQVVNAQIFEPFHLRYQYLPQVEASGADDEAFERVERNSGHLFESSLRYPLMYGKKGGLVLIEYGFKAFIQDYEQWPLIEAEPLNAYHHRLAVKGVIPVNEKWNLLAIGNIAQGINQSVNWDFDQQFYRLGLGFLVQKDPINQIGLSILYVQEINFIVPAFIYKGASKNEKWLFNIEAPQLSVAAYCLSDNTRIRFEQRLDNDRFVFDDAVTQTADNYNAIQLNVSAGISQRIKGPLFFNLSAGITPLNVLMLYENRNETIETISFPVQPTFSAALYMSINPNDYVK